MPWAGPSRTTLAILCAATGCAQTFGLDPTSNTGRTNSVEVDRISIGKKVVKQPADLTALAATYYVGDAFTPKPAVADAARPGVFAVKLPDPAPVVLSVPDQPPLQPLQMFSFSSSAISVPLVVAADPDAEPVSPDAMLTVSATLDAPVAADESFEIFTAGSWTRHPISAAVAVAGATTVGPETYQFAGAEDVGRVGEIMKLTTEDSVFVLRHLGRKLTGVAEAQPFAQSVNDTPTMSPMTRVEASSSLDFEINPPALNTRYAAVMPQVTTLAMQWQLVAAPASARASSVGPLLLSGALGIDDLGVLDTYGNPFAANLHWNTLLFVSTSKSRTFMPEGAMSGIGLFAGMNQYVEPTGHINITMPASLPKLITLNSNPLSEDGKTIAAPSQFVEVSFVADGANATFYVLELFDFVASTGGTGFTRTSTFVASAAVPRFAVPPEVLQAGHTYALRANCAYGGFPNIADGDLVTREVPFAVSFLDSAVFTVTP